MDTDSRLAIVAWGWKRFDRTTAYSCAMQNRPYDDELCRATYASYLALIDTLYRIQTND